MRPKPKQISDAVKMLMAIPYFPREAGAQAAIMTALASFVADVDKLDWLVTSAVNAMSEWQGVAQLRALYATRWRPFDGIEGQSCALPGHTPGDCEASHAQLQAGASQRYLPAADDTQITDEERAQIAALAERLRLRGERDGTRKLVDVKPPAWLERLA